MDTLLSIGESPVTGTEKEEQAMLVTGDRVKIHNHSMYYQSDNPSNPIVVEGTVTKISDSTNMNVKVIWDNGYRNVYDCSDLIIVEGILWEN